MALGRLSDPSDGRCVLVEAFDAEGRLGRAVVLALGRAWHLAGHDAAGARVGERRGRVHGLGVGGRGPEEIGVDKASLNFAVLREVFEEGAEIGAGPVLRFSRAVLVFASRWYQLESLYRANAKYNPEWVPRYLLFDTSRDVAKVSLASATAEGFLPDIDVKAWFRPAGAQGSPLLEAAKGVRRWR